MREKSGQFEGKIRLAHPLRTLHSCWGSGGSSAFLGKRSLLNTVLWSRNYAEVFQSCEIEFEISHKAHTMDSNAFESNLQLEK